MRRKRVIGARICWPISLVLLGVLTVATASGIAIAGPTAVDVTTAVDGLECPTDDDGAVFATDSGLVVIHDGRFLHQDPFVNETTLSFPNVTVGASDNASVQIAAAAERGLCVRDVQPTDAPVALSPTAGPRVVVADEVGTLAYGKVDYARRATHADLTYSAASAARIEVAAGDLEAGQSVLAVDADDGATLDATDVTDDGTVALRLPAGTRTVDLRLAPVETETKTPGPVGGNTGGGSSFTATETPSRSLDEPRRTEAVGPPGSSESDGAPAWQAELVDYRPSPQTKHVGGFLPLTLLLWLLALYLILVRDGSEATVLGTVLVTASIRATSDLFQVLLEGFVGVEASIAAINLLLELVLAVQFLTFAATYTDEQRLRTKWAKRGLGGAGALGAAAIATNPIHGLVFADVEVAGGPFTYVATNAGPAGLAIVAFNMSLIVVGGGLLLRSFLGPSVREVWRPVAVIATGLGLAVLVSVVDALDLGPVSGYNYTAAGVNYFVLATTVALVGYGFHRLKTGGRKSIIADLEDAIVILDDAWTVVQWNLAAKRLFPDIATGRSFDAVLPEPLERPAAGKRITREVSIVVEGEPIGSTGNAAGTTGARGGTRSSDPDGRGVDDPQPDGGHVERGDVLATGADGIGGLDPESGDERPADDDPEPQPEHFVVSATPVTTDTDDVIGYTVRFADVTDLKRRMGMLQERNEQLDQFASAITKDLRTPLSEAERSTVRALEILRSADGTESVDRSSFASYLAAIDEALDRITRIIEDILGLVRGSDLRTDPQTVAFDRIVESAWEGVPDYDATVRLESSGELVADPEHLERILEQLFHNAVEHGGDDVTVRVGLDADGFYVADDGPGVSEWVRDRVFDPGVTTKDDASGLGLAVAEQRARANGWDVSLADPPEGARFVVTGCDVTPAGANGGGA